MPKELTWRKSIEKVLSEASGAVHYTDLTERIIEEGLRSSLGATPAATVGAQLSMAIKKEGNQCPFQKIGKGLYVWKEKAGITQTPLISKGDPTDDRDEDEVQYDIITSFGMFWQRGSVEWQASPRILGMQQMKCFTQSETNCLSELRMISSAW